MIIGTLVKKHKPANVRAFCGLTMQQLADLARVSRTVVHFAEHHHPISRLSAAKILGILNPIWTTAGHRELEIDDMDWIVQGDGKARKPNI